MCRDTRYVPIEKCQEIQDTEHRDDMPVDLGQELALGSGGQLWELLVDGRFKLGVRLAFSRVL